jgi:predicted deacylase
VFPDLHSSGKDMPEHRVAANNREDLQNLLLALAALAVSIALCIGINLFLYNGYTGQQAEREREEIRRRLMCTELRRKRDAQPSNLHVAMEYKRCTINRSSIGKRA